MRLKKGYLMAMFLGAVLIQLCVPIYMAWHREDVLKTGVPFYFTTTIVDPYDAFRGLYIDLAFKQNRGLVLDYSENKSGYYYRKTVYAVLAADSNGRAFIREISLNEPVGVPYVKAKFLGFDPYSNLARVSFPFKRYYLPEKFAPAAEKSYNEHSRKESAAALVRIKDGYGVIEKVFLDDKDLLEYLRED